MLPEHSNFDHKIKLNDQFTPQHGKIYLISLNEQKVLDEFIEENLTIRLSSNSTLLLWTQDQWRPMPNPRLSLPQLSYDPRPLPPPFDIRDLRQHQAGQVFHKAWGFNNIRIREGNEWKVTFITNEGLFEPTMMFFRLMNSPAMFQWMMDTIFRKAILTKQVKVYIDDILVHSETLQEHAPLVQLILQILQENGLSYKPMKCEFEQTQIEYLGLIIEQGRVKMNLKKISAIVD
jgi:hypothetical protein